MSVNQASNQKNSTVVEARFAPLPKPGRRWGAAVIDFLIFILIFLGVFYLAAMPILDSSVNIYSHQTAAEADRRNSNLYTITYIDEDGNDLELGPQPPSANLPDGATGFQTATVLEANYGQAVYEYYTEYKVNRVTESDEYILDLYNLETKEDNIELFNFRQDANAAIQTQLNEYGLNEDGGLTSEQITVETFSPATAETWYIERILLINHESSLFEYVAETSPSAIKRSSTTSETSEEEEVKEQFLPAGVGVKSGKSSEVNSFFTSAFAQAFNQDFPNEADHRIVNQYTTIGIVVGLFVSSAIVYLVFPLIFKHGATLGKKMLGVGVVNTYGFRAKWWQYVARYLAFYLFTIMIDLYTIQMFGIPLVTFISFTMGMFGKKNRALHDFIAGTRPVDLKTGKIYDNADDELDANPPIIEQIYEDGEEEWVNFEDRLIVGAPAKIDENITGEDLKDVITSSKDAREIEDDYSSIISRPDDGEKITDEEFASIFTKGDDSAE